MTRCPYCNWKTLNWREHVVMGRCPDFIAPEEVADLLRGDRR